MGIKLDVPMVVQMKNNSCWYASCCMVAYYRVAGPRLGLPKKWAENNGINIPDFVRLAQTEGLKALTSPTGSLSEDELAGLLRKNGPLWCAGQWDGVGHIVVLTGVDGGNVYINDPNPSVKQRVETVAWFNTKLDNHVPGCLMSSPAG